ncbi:ABC transporter ATP-binding protein [uncultured Finegoldia sp.]|uniref:ABC transporter ATP-binding protein n=1 Tax=uncultured Finegoldia sp. TaxID=328009 RepID=UPI002628FA83|nr:ABC transporter ATP-binding protein [uncultured Finegoldia sp.]
MSKNKYKDTDRLKREQELSETILVEETIVNENEESETTAVFASEENEENKVNDEKLSAKQELSEEIRRTSRVAKDYTNRPKVIEVDNLNVSFNTYAGEVKAVRGVTFDIYDGEALALVGESGCGKTVVSKSILQILPKSAVIKEPSSIRYMNEEVLKMDKKRLRQYKGSDVSMIFQDPMTSLNPTMKIGKQITESLLLHTDLSKDEANKEAIKLLKTVNIPNAEERVNQYPHELSGGMRQRVMIAIALACNPNVILADEPTTALDVTIQAQILDLMRELRDTKNTSIVLVTHDLGVVADFADRIQVMYAGEIMETGTVQEIFKDAHHPYTWALLMSVPRLDSSKDNELYSLGGTPPDLLMEIPGCPFAARCDYAMQICKEQKPPQTKYSEHHVCRCWLTHEQAPKVERPY